MNLFKQRQPKRFNYTPRLRNDPDKAHPNEFEIKRRQHHQRKKKAQTLPMLLVFLGMVIVIWYVLSTYEI